MMPPPGLQIILPSRGTQTFDLLKSIVSCRSSLLCEPLGTFASTSVHSFSKYHFHVWQHTNGQTDERTRRKHCASCQSVNNRTVNDITKRSYSAQEGAGVENDASARSLNLSSASCDLDLLRPSSCDTMSIYRNNVPSVLCLLPVQSGGVEALKYKCTKHRTCMAWNNRSRMHHVLLCVMCMWM